MVKLSKIEKDLLEHAKQGTWLEFAAGLKEDGKTKNFKAPTLDKKDNPHITIEADFIRRLLLGLIEENDKPIVGVFIRGAVIKGKLDLRDATLKGFNLPPLRLDDCLIIGDYKKDPDKKNDLFDPVIDARYCSLKRLTLKRSRIGIIDIRGAKVDGNLDMDSVQPIDAESNACLIAENATINGNINLRACQLRLDIPANRLEGYLEYTDALSLYEAKVNGSLMIFDRKEKELDKDGKPIFCFPKITGRISLSYAEISKNVWIYNTEMQGDIRNRSSIDPSPIAILASTLKCHAFRIDLQKEKHIIENKQEKNYSKITGDIHLHYANIEYLHIGSIRITGNLALNSSTVATQVVLVDTYFDNYHEIKVEEGERKNKTLYAPLINLVNSKIGSDLKVNAVHCGEFTANNTIIAGGVDIKDYPPGEFFKYDWIDAKNEYSEPYKKRLIDFDNASIGSDFKIETCFVGQINAKNIQIKGDAKFKDTFARFNFKLANIQGDFSIDNSNATVLATALTEDHPLHKVVFSGIPKITVNDIEVSGKVALDELIINAEYNLGDAKPEIDFSGGRFKSAFIIGNISFIRTFKPSRPTFTLDDAVIEGDLHFENHKQLVKHVDKFCSHFTTKKFDLSAAKQPSITQFNESEIKNILFSIEEFSKIKDDFKNFNEFQRFAYLIGFAFEEVFERENNKLKYMTEELNSFFEALFAKLNKLADVLEKPDTFQSKFILFKTLKERISSRIEKFINKNSGYFNGWDIKNLNHKTIKEYEISCYPNHNYVELIGEIKTESSTKYATTTAFLVHKIDKNLSIHLDGTSQPIHKLNSNKDNLVIKNKGDALQYLRFFCAHVRGEYGAFWVIDDPCVLFEFISFSEPYYFHLAIYNNLMKYSCYRVDGNYWKLNNVIVLYGDALFLAKFEIDAKSGMVTMIKDEPIAELKRQVSDIKHYKYADYRERNKSNFSNAKVIGLDVKKPKIIDLEYTRYVLLHLMHVNLSLNSVISNTFKFDLNGKKHNFGCGINLRMDGFEYKRLADNDEDLRVTTSLDQTTKAKDGANDNSIKFNQASGDVNKLIKSNSVSIDKYEGIEGVLDAQYDNHFWPTHNGFDSQPYEQMAKVLYKIGAYRPAKAVFLKKIKHEALAQHWRAKIKLRNKLIDNKADPLRGFLYLKHYIQYAIFSCSQHVELSVKPFKVRIKENVMLYKARIKEKDESLYDEIKEYFSNRKAK